MLFFIDLGKLSEKNILNKLNRESPRQTRYAITENSIEKNILLIVRPEISDTAAIHTKPKNPPNKGSLSPQINGDLFRFLFILNEAIITL